MRYGKKEEKEIDRARLNAGLPPNRKDRACLGCGTVFESRGQRFCRSCTVDRYAMMGCPWENQTRSPKRGIPR